MVLIRTRVLWSWHVGAIWENNSKINSKKWLEIFNKFCEGVIFDMRGKRNQQYSRRDGQLLPTFILQTMGFVLGILLMLFPGEGVAKNPTIEDQDIHMAVEAALFTDPQIPENAIDVDVRDGIVMLEGTVSNLLAKERAIQTIETIKGVRGIVNQILVSTVVPSDKELKQNVIYALAKDSTTDAYEIKVNVRHGIVTLKGKVESWQEKQLSENVAKGVKGVVEVHNELNWDPVTNRPDSEIQADIIGRLEADPWITHDFINVNVQGGKVALSGSIGSLVEKRRAKIDAWVTGVKEVEAENLQVEWWVRSNLKRTSHASRPDEYIRDAIKDVLFYDPRVNSHELNVTVEGGSVTLTGVVDNLKAKKAAAEGARHTIGVWHVRNLIKVRPQIHLTDEEIAENVRTMLKLDPFLKEKEIAVSVNDGQAYLTGAVDYGYEKSRAEDMASRAIGVVNVTNYITVSSVWTWRTDLEIQKDINTELWWSPFVDSDEVKVDVEQGVATLTGVVDSWTERTIAEENAYEGGAKNVVNKLQIRPIVEG